MKSLFRALLAVCAMSMASGVSATLIDRGNGLIYDDVLDITWLQDANLDGLKTGFDAVAWADTLVYEGYDDWRLPYISVAAGAGPLSIAQGAVECATATEAECRDNELGYMYYYNMDGTGNNTGTQTVDGIDLTNVQFVHWSGTANDTFFAWVFVFEPGFKTVVNELSGFGAWAVRPGDSLSVPATEPTVTTLLALGLLGTGLGVRRRQRRSH